MSAVSARERYESWVGAILTHAASRRGDDAAVDYRTPEVAVMEFEEAGWTRVHSEDLPADLAHLAEASREELLGKICELQAERDDARHQTLRALMKMLFGGGPEPVAVAERMFALARTVCSDAAWGLKQWEVGALFGDIRQTWQQKEKRMIEELITRYSTIEFTNAGGKSASARAKLSKDRRGNTSRKLGRRKGDHAQNGTAPKQQTITQQERMDAREVAREAERERIAEMCGVDPEEIDLDRISPERE